MKHISIISDTHGLLREQVMAEITSSDCIMHAGDINTPYIVEYMREHGEAYVVRGNNDKNWSDDLPISLTVTIEGVRFYIVHNRKDIPKHLDNVDVVIYGHSHKFSAEVINEVLYLNPGSCGKRRFNLQITMCRMFVEAGRYKYEKVVIPHDNH